MISGMKWDKYTSENENLKKEKYSFLMKQERHGYWKHENVINTSHCIFPYGKYLSPKLFWVTNLALSVNLE